VQRLAVMICAALGLVPALPAAARPVDLAAVCFTPGEDCAGLIVHAIGSAARSSRSTTPRCSGAEPAAETGPQAHSSIQCVGPTPSRRANRLISSMP
jgi:hypothetical protein